MVFLPCPSQLDVGHTMLLAKCKLKSPVLVELAAVEPQILLKGLKDKCLFI